MLLDGCGRSGMAFDISRHMDRFDIFEVAKAGFLAPIQKLADGVIIRDPGVLVPDRHGEELKKPLGGFETYTRTPRSIPHSGHSSSFFRVRPESLVFS